MHAKYQVAGRYSYVIPFSRFRLFIFSRKFTWFLASEIPHHIRVRPFLYIWYHTVLTQNELNLC